MTHYPRPAKLNLMLGSDSDSGSPQSDEMPEAPTFMRHELLKRRAYHERSFDFDEDFLAATDEAPERTDDNIGESFLSDLGFEGWQKTSSEETDTNTGRSFNDSGEDDKVETNVCTGTRFFSEGEDDKVGINVRTRLFSEEEESSESELPIDVVEENAQFEVRRCRIQSTEVKKVVKEAPGNGRMSLGDLTNSNLPSLQIEQKERESSPWEGRIFNLDNVFDFTDEETSRSRSASCEIQDFEQRERERPFKPRSVRNLTLQLSHLEDFHELESQFADDYPNLTDRRHEQKRFWS